jgi:hypothetical protein
MFVVYNGTMSMKKVMEPPNWWNGDGMQRWVSVVEVSSTDVMRSLHEVLRPCIGADICAQLPKTYEGANIAHSCSHEACREELTEKKEAVPGTRFYYSPMYQYGDEMEEIAALPKEDALKKLQDAQIARESSVSTPAAAFNSAATTGPAATGLAGLQGEVRALAETVSTMAATQSTLAANQLMLTKAVSGMSAKLDDLTKNV